MGENRLGAGHCVDDRDVHPHARWCPPRLAGHEPPAPLRARAGGQVRWPPAVAQRPGRVMPAIPSSSSPIPLIQDHRAPTMNPIPSARNPPPATTSASRPSALSQAAVRRSPGREAKARTPKPRGNTPSNWSSGGNQHSVSEQERRSADCCQRSPEPSWRPGAQAQPAQNQSQRSAPHPRRSGQVGERTHSHPRIASSSQRSSGRARAAPPASSPFRRDVSANWSSASPPETHSASE